MMQNAPAFFEVLYGAWHAGLSAVPINAKLHSREAAYILEKSGVTECSVVGRPNADWGDEVVAFVVTAPDKRVMESELDGLCLEHIARFKRPKAYRFIAALPRNNYGKALKTELRPQLATEVEAEA